MLLLQLGALLAAGLASMLSEGKNKETVMSCTTTMA